MYNFKINFSHPWLLLLLIPAIALTLIPYFRLAKRYRRTRNRITSIVLHLLVMVFAIGALAGMTFDYQIVNTENEIIYLVDVSDSEETSKKNRDDFLEFALQDSQYDGYKVGVVTFGFNQVYAAQLTYNADSVFDKYLDAELPDTSATDIASALTYTKSLFSHPRTAKIVLITDGKETDENASRVIRSVTSSGVRIDVAYVPSEITDYDAQIVEAKFPEYHMTVGEEYAVEVIVESKEAVTAILKMADNGANVVWDGSEKKTVNLTAGKQSISLPFTFTEDGLHEVLFDLTTDKNEAFDQNNAYCTYHYLEVYNRILIIESKAGTSEQFKNMLTADGGKYEFSVKHIEDESMPKTVDELRQYDQVVLNNISNSDLVNRCSVPNFDVMLNDYVEKYGGGMFTIGGSEAAAGTVGGSADVAHAYNRADMADSKNYQKMLPVQAINYTPPLGVVFCLDTSGSMSNDDGFGHKKLDLATTGMTACIFDSLTERDYVGIVTFDDSSKYVLEMTPRTRESTIRNAISTITKATASTNLDNCILTAGQMLQALKTVDKRHIVIISDGLTNDTQAVVEKVKNFNKDYGITVSVVGIAMRDGVLDNGYVLANMIAQAGKGRVITSTGETLTKDLRAELNVKDLKEVNQEEFYPTIPDILSPLVRDLDRFVTTEETTETETKQLNKLSVSLDGFYGVKVRPTADLILTGEYNVPIYAQWKYGEGMVGSFMCDLDGVWSSKFIADPNGRSFIKNVVDNLMPLQSIRPTDIVVGLQEDNYINKLSISGELQDGETMKGEIIDLETNEKIVDLNKKAEDIDWNTESSYVLTPLSAANNYSRCDFVVRQSGTYKIVISKYDADGTLISSLEFYKSFAYSKEYDSSLYTEEEAILLRTKLEDLAARGGGKFISDLEDPSEIFEGFVTAFDRSFDPRMLFMILAIVLFLLDIAVRKFKFKWPHEIIRAYKAKHKDKKNGQR